ncbi:MAG: Gfo/Idh/MocA family oxidoreductase [Treponema sp.]|nr:Gfo/Idh/MocA family oxidoreductase [Treponema sp.]
MSQEKIYTAAIVGLGRIGYSLGLDKKREQPASHTMALEGNRRIKIIAGCDKNAEACAEWRNHIPSAKTFSDSSLMYKNINPDIITIAVNEDAHFEEAIKAIEAKPRLIILEKPVATNLNDARKIQECADRNGVPVLVNHERRFSDDYAAAKSYMSEIGPLQEIQASLYSGMAVYIPGEDQTGAYSLLHDGTHLIDTILYFLEDINSPSQLIAIAEKESSTQKKDDNDIFFKNRNADSKTIMANSLLKRPVISGIVIDEQGKTRQLNAFYVTHSCPSVNVFMSGRSLFFGFEIALTGTDGRICIGNGYCKLYKAGESALYEGFKSLVADTETHIPKKTYYFANMIKNAVDFLDGKADLKSTLQTGINSLAILEEIKRKLV